MTGEGEEEEVKKKDSTEKGDVCIMQNEGWDQGFERLR